MHMNMRLKLPIRRIHHHGHDEEIDEPTDAEELKGEEVEESGHPLAQVEAVGGEDSEEEPE